MVNQPFVFGWHDGQLYVQAYAVLEDDKRDWQHAEKKLLSKSLAARLQQEVRAHHEQVDWDLVAHLAQSPRAVPVPITASDASAEAAIASAVRVQNVLPEGSTWDGKSDLPMDEAAFEQMVGELEPDSDTAAPARRDPRRRQGRQGARAGADERRLRCARHGHAVGVAAADAR